MTEKIGWIGTGLMGKPMASRLLAAGYPLTVHTRTKIRAEPLLRAGATWADTAGDVARTTDVIVTMLPAPADVASAYRGTGGLLARAHPGTTMIDMSTSSPELARELAAEGSGLGIDVLDAPVTGGPGGAESGSLSVMVGGAPAALARVEPLLRHLASTVVHHGGPGSGQLVKLANQVLVASTMVAVGEAFALVRASEVKPESALASLRAGVAGSPLLVWAWQKLVDDDDAPGFKVDHLLKDLDLAVAEATQSAVRAEASRPARELYQVVRDTFGGDVGTQAVARLFDVTAQEVRK